MTSPRSEQRPRASTAKDATTAKNTKSTKKPAVTEAAEAGAADGGMPVVEEFPVEKAEAVPGTADEAAPAGKPAKTAARGRTAAKGRAGNGGRAASAKAPAAGAAKAGTGAGARARPAARRKAAPDPGLIAELDRLVDGHHHDPHALLGVHTEGRGTVVRALRPGALEVHAVLADGSRLRLDHLHRGVFSAKVSRSRLTAAPDYRIAARYEADGPEHVAADPYRFAPTLGDLDLHLIGEGRHEELWNALGAHTRVEDTAMGEVAGTGFAVWAPDARGVRLIGDFNYWNGTGHPMRSLGATGVWELFLPGVGDGALYKFQILGADGHWRDKADPMARCTQMPPATASVVTTSAHTWGDQEWMAERKGVEQHRAPMSVYEVHLGSWRPGLGYAELAEQLVEYVSDMGFTHVELLPVAGHPYDGSWGYQVTSYYAPTPRFGSPDEFRHLVDSLHRAGIGVFLDWVPAHFPKDDWALARFDGTALYEHPDPRRGEHPDWGTLIFNYGRTEVRNFLIANALYWLEEFHIDGLRVDAVASMIYLDYSRDSGAWEPNAFGGRENLEAIDFLKDLNTVVYRRNPHAAMIAEESTAYTGVTTPVDHGGLGFGFKWNMGWMHDTLEYVKKEPIHRQYHHDDVTFSMVYAYSENYVLPLSHDEVVHGKQSLFNKPPGDEWQRSATLRALLAFMWSHPGKQLLFMGGEIAQGDEWLHQEGVPWWLLQFDHHAGVQRLVRALNEAYRPRPALWSRDTDPAGFRWLDGGDREGNTLSYLRHGDGGSVLACAVNFSPVPRTNWRMGLPSSGRWNAVLNTDEARFGGSDHPAPAHVDAEATPWHGQPFSAEVTLPPLGGVWFEPER
ncbi:1,4-alpha-glucan branching enzyme [Nocardiopsis arvandica]|uniref:1,4-alpha-glucan branching enzyme GlgB n=1 Tax=Nocardiopsis sinuspersici TaxID=501010 RepID=A0A7Y9XF86_9ACTN|nr:1,4-alpha-glucan branching protein GlgB [Nocardiopsis sinuspersici]NYH53697.1 1,4-alpha-glucan branching enzyme [Nocardiopsis sinuspersici]